MKLTNINGRERMIYEKGDTVERLLVLTLTNGKAFAIGAFAGKVDDDEPSANPRYLRDVVWINGDGVAKYEAELVDTIGGFEDLWKTKKYKGKVQLAGVEPMRNETYLKWAECMAKHSEETK